MTHQTAFFKLDHIDLLTALFHKKKEAGDTDFFSWKIFKKGEYLYFPGEKADRVYFVSDGRVKTGNYSVSGKEITKSIVSRGEAFGELALIDQNARTDFAVTMEPTKVFIIATHELKSLMRTYSGLSFYVMETMGTRAIEMEQRLEALIFKNSRTRIVDFINNLAHKRGQRVGYEFVIRKFLTHQEIANLTATSRQTVTTVLNELRRKNILTFNRRRMLIRDMDLLKAEAA